jgi:hypothetical protein
MFGSTAFLQLNGVAISMQNIFRSIKNKQLPSQSDIRRFVISYGLANFLFTFVANFAQFISDDEEDKEKAKRAMLDSLFGLNLLYQIPIIGTGLETMVSKARGERKPISDAVNPIISVYRKIDKEMEAKGWTGAIRPVIEIGVGAQFDPFIGLYSGVADGFDENNIYDIMGISQSYRPGEKTKTEMKQDAEVEQDIKDIQQFGMTREELKKSNPGMYKIYFPEDVDGKERMQPPAGGYVPPGSRETKRSSTPSSGYVPPSQR